MQLMLLNQEPIIELNIEQDSDYEPLVKGAKIEGNEVTYSLNVQSVLCGQYLDYYFLEENLQKVKVSDKDKKTLQKILSLDLASKPVFDSVYTHGEKKIPESYLTAHVLGFGGEGSGYDREWQKLDNIMEKYFNLQNGI